MCAAFWVPEGEEGSSEEGEGEQEADVEAGSSGDDGDADMEAGSLGSEGEQLLMGYDRNVL